MRNILLSAGVAGAMGVLAMGSANAAPIAVHGVIAAPAVTTDVACRTVKKVVVKNGVRRVTTTQQCTRAPVVSRRVYVAPRRYYRPAPRPGIVVRVR